MAATITYYGHSAFLVEDDAHAVAIDPFLTGNDRAPVAPADVTCQSIVLTHGHADHFGDTLSIAARNDAAVFAVFEIIEHLAAQGHGRGEPMNPGGRVETDFGWVALVRADHSSSYEGVYMGVACGAIVNIGGVTIYHLGDTALFSDMKLIGEIYRPDVAMVPIGDRFTMGPDLAARAAELIGAPVAIPVHYDTWPLIAQDPARFAPSGVEVRVMQPGDRWTTG